MKKLYLLRHAKSSWKEPGLSDFDRPLNKRGENDAPFMAKKLIENSEKIDSIISSPANRALTTARTFADQLDYPLKKIRTNMDIYSGDLKCLYRIIHYCNNEHKSVLLVGHNPLITYFAESLCNEDFGNIPTCGIVGMQFNIDGWDIVSAGNAKLDFFTYPKMYR